MFKGVDHVVIAVKDLDAAVGRYETIYGAEVSDRSEAPAAGMAMAFSGSAIRTSNWFPLLVIRGQSQSAWRNKARACTSLP
jgi:catechol 2,3-dioxygenase-like lactoylglutathione lyase family enzyme